MYRKQFYYHFRDLDAGDLSHAFEATLEKLGVDTGHVELRIIQVLSDGTSEERNLKDIRELDAICDLTNIDVTFFEDFSASGFVFSVGQGQLAVQGESIRVHARASTPKLISDINTSLAKELRLKPLDETRKSSRAPASKSRNEPTESGSRMDEAFGGFSSTLSNAFTYILSELEAMKRRVDLLEGKSSSKRLQCFLSYRYMEGNDRLIKNLKEFLFHLQVDVIDASKYEPRSVVSKVKSRLGKSLDVVVWLVAEGGESGWTRDEVSDARGRGISVIPLVEKGRSIDPGMFGDIEIIYFDRHLIVDAFLKLAQGLEYIRQSKTAQIEKSDD